MLVANVNGIDIAYERQGQGSPLVLLHGYPLDHSIWHETARLLGTTFDVILPDLRGFGQSSFTAQEYGMSDLAGDIAGLLDQLGLERAIIAGHSMGGYVALAFAHAYPERVSGLGLISSQAGADTPEGRERRFAAVEQVEHQGVEPVAASMPEKLSSDAEVRASCEELIRKQPPEGIIGALKAMAAREDARPWLASFDFPVGLMHGDADALIPVARAREAGEALPKSNLSVIPGGGHMLMMESPQATAEALRALA
jgi:3-oxoadipate enol-lactonase